jgi:dUTP pyrophosphatase
VKIKIKRFDKSLPLPRFHSSGAVGLDLAARLETTIAAGKVGYIPLNVAVELPEGCWLMLAARSSTHKLGLMPANGIGIGDPDFSGNEDEYQLAVFNFTTEPVKVAKGARVAQAIIVPFTTIEVEEVEDLGSPSRGGFGSTGQ